MNMDRLRSNIDNFLAKNKGPSKVDDNILIVDGTNIFISVFAAVPQLNENGDHIGGVAGFLKAIGARIRQFNCTRCFVVFDGEGGSKRRKKIFPEYKNNRKVKTTLNRWNEFDGYIDEQESLKKQFLRVNEYLDHMPVNVISVNNIEADDVISYIVRKMYGDDYEGMMTIMSSDKDFLQLISHNVQVWSNSKKKLYDKEAMLEDYGMTPKNFVLYRAFSGDTSDNIDGVKGIGIKGLQKRFPEIQTEDLSCDHFVDRALEEIENGSKLKFWKTIAENKEKLDRNYDLMQLDDSIINSSLEYAISKMVTGKITPINRMAIYKMFLEDGMDSSIKDINQWLTNTFMKLNIYAG